MARARPPRQYRTARERATLRRNRNSSPVPSAAISAPSTVSTARQRIAARQRMRRRGSGCNSIFVGLGAAGLLVVFLLVMVAGIARDSLREVQQLDPRQNQAFAGGDASADNTPQENAAQAGAAAHSQPFNVLLLGVDSRDDADQGVRSDTLIVVHVDPQEQWASMLSIPRDSVTQIPHLGQQKINAAYTFGYGNADDIYGRGTDPDTAGGALAAETVEQFLDIRIDYIAQVDFHGFERVVNTFGGLTIDAPQPLLDPEYPTENFGVERLYIPAGIQVMDGTTALRYARSRHSGSDFDRSCRQQRVLRALLREVRQRNVLDQAALLPDLVEDITSSVSTTMPVSEPGFLYSMAQLAQNLSTDRIMQYSINPSNVQVVSEQSSDIYWNQADIDLLVNRMMQGPQGMEEKVATIQVQNGAGVRGLAGRVTLNLGGQGFSMVEAGDAPGIYPSSMVIDYTGHPETRQRLANALGIAADYVYAEPPDNAPTAPYNTDIVLVLGEDYQESWADVNDTTTSPPPPAPAATTPQEEVPDLPPGCSPDF